MALRESFSLSFLCCAGSFIFNMTSSVEFDDSVVESTVSRRKYFAVAVYYGIGIRKIEMFEKYSCYKSFKTGVVRGCFESNIKHPQCYLKLSKR